MSTLQLTIPTPQEDGVKPNKVKPRDVAKWLGDLPFLDLQRTAPAIHQQLRLFNRQPIPAAQRLQILDAFRSAYARLKNTRPGKHQTLSFSLETLQKKLCQDLAFGYKIALQDLLNKRLMIGQKRLIGHAIGGAMDCLSEHITYFYADYQHTPRSLWSEAVALFRFAREMDIASQSLVSSDEETVSIQQIFTTMALLRLADPYQLQANAVWHLRRYLDKRVNQVDMLDSSMQQMPNQINLIIDNSNDIKTHILMVNIARLLEQLNADLASLDQPRKTPLSGFPEEISTHEITYTLKRVIATWNWLVNRKSTLVASMAEHNKRKSERVEVHQSLELAAGIPAIWYVQNDKRPFNADLYDPRHSHDIDLSRPQTEPVSTVSASHEVLVAKTINRSKGGVALHVEKSPETTIHVGQLVALSRADTATTGNWVMAACRWLIERSGGTRVDIGLQYLSSEARPVAARNRISESIGSGFMPAFIVSQKQQDVLMAQAGSYRPDSLIDIYENGQKLSVRCEKLLEACSGYERFSYKVIE